MEHPNKTFKNMVRNQLISRGHNDKVWCFWYQHSVWLVRCLINLRIGTAPIIPCLKEKEKIKWWEMIIWGWKVYVVNYKTGNKYLDSRMSTDTRMFVGPLSNENIPHQADSYFMGYSNNIKSLLYDTNTHRVKRIHHAYVDKHDIQIHTK